MKLEYYGEIIELEYLEDIKGYIEESIEQMKKGGYGFETGIHWAVHENDCMDDDYKEVRDCHYIGMGAYSVETNNIENIPEIVSVIGKDKMLLHEIKRSVDVIKSGKYDNYFTEEDKKYIYEDIKTIENSDLLN